MKKIIRTQFYLNEDWNTWEITGSFPESEYTGQVPSDNKNGYIFDDDTAVMLSNWTVIEFKRKA